MLLTAGADLTDSIAGADDDYVVKPDVGIGRHIDDSDGDVEEEVGGGRGRGGAGAGSGHGGIRDRKDRGIGEGRLGGRASMHMGTAALDDSPSIVRKKGVEDDDEF